MLTQRAFQRGQRGFTLIEVLVTLVVVSVGLLGFAGLLTNSIAANRQAYMRSQASILAHDLSERMRANRAGTLVGAYSMADKGSATGNDALDWVGLVGNALPDGDATVSTGASGDGVTVTITIRWTDGNAYSFTTQTTI
jgi:type IV pilus assembly protein PilV